MDPTGADVERLRKDLAFLFPERNSNSQTLTLQAPETTKWSVLALVIAGMVSLFALYIAADAKAQARADRQELLDEIRALKDDTKGIRAYINTGILKPLPEDKRDAE